MQGSLGMGWGMAANFKIMTEEDIKPSRKPYNFVNWEQKKCVQYFDPQKPNEDKPWCLKCKRHYEIKRVGRAAYSSGGGDSYKCRKCGSRLTAVLDKLNIVEMFGGY